MYVGLQIATDETRESVADSLRDDGYRVTDMTDNEAAKLHVRHMVGGRGVGNKNELLYRFEFPERPGALLRFLNGPRQPLEHHPVSTTAITARLGPGTHRLRGAACGSGALVDLPGSIGYRYWEETGNPAVELFLR